MWMSGQAVVPALIGRAIDAGSPQRDTAALSTGRRGSCSSGWCRPAPASPGTGSPSATGWSRRSAPSSWSPVQAARLGRVPAGAGRHRRRGERDRGRRVPGRRRVRRLGPGGRRGRVLPRRRGDPAALLGLPRPGRPARRPAADPVRGAAAAPAQAPPVRAAPAGRRADHAGRGHGRRPARAARDRRRGHVPAAVPGQLAAGPGGRRPGGQGPGAARRGAGPAARRLRRHRDLAGRPARGRGRPHGRPAGRVLRLRRLPGHPAAHGDRGRRQGDHRAGLGGPGGRDPAAASRCSPSPRRRRRSRSGRPTWSTPPAAWWSPPAGWSGSLPRCRRRRPSSPTAWAATSTPTPRPTG